MVSVRVSLNLKRRQKIFPQETIMVAGENRFAPELNEKEFIELLENAAASIKKATKHDMKIFQCKNLKTLYILTI